MENTLKKINNIPVRTWRWLGVNNVNINEALPQVVPYNNEYITSVKNDGIEVNKMSQNISSDFNGTCTYTGIDELSLNQVKNDYNTGVYVHSSKYSKCSEPIVINYYMNEANNTVVDNNLIIAEEGSEITVVVNYDSDENTTSFHNGLTQIYAKANSVVNLVKIQTLSGSSLHLDAHTVKTEENAVVNYTAVDLGSKYAVTNYTDDLSGFRSSANVKSIYLGDKDRVIDINYLINHYGKDARSNIETRGALMDRSKKTFRGTLDFKKGCKKSKGEEEEYTVLLSPHVINKSVPILLCTEEDVDGQHAASAGRIDENKLFYIMSRGFSETEAKKLVIEAAFNPIINQIPSEEIKNKISTSIRRRLENE
ncbi:hypothetical protein BJV85_000613 [Clostridium acetobutylicum]|uniref:Iron-regulated ABC-type transporter membrane component (SufB) n=1 Tax=Clostridium acetobutylicum (strain ATCC 824 / DSM 792 / JCM 1419 / IAM 19013 / LMG 5710 / NBRC 13948 / NRRL B-527 / VKM B-1787 / 2291 / W) TaxID=272562 RepID=Q97E26_CLOAB|nr:MULTISPECIES: Fe-S cluster assembly protein SufD [Clostridium]AAK81224.1 Iron-regulated ABC-type transporter membrane component (SufB) [Clostridium acetobutylicum ATCC 824]ADZ22329.1 Iron-regulated ABC-type transporter membrane component (SufB) [Clostridium acetobutylicum EA 2018]AEI33367.1 Iron-regulated ABC-type transporter membrane component (SufB) [Clostridium acetobutylicum DSM 1731]AWV81108.1 Fe-S cluster assembly protein SufD [Clostridium acetobutylicum]MBC2395691.1 Fe-S cluster asse